MKNKIEEWKDVPNYEGLYQASTFGRVRRLKVGNREERILAQTKIPSGYLMVGISKRSYFVHQVIAMTFLNHVVGGYKNVVNHKDFDRTNNNLSNLEIVSQRQNSNLQHFDSAVSSTGVVISNSKKNPYTAQIKVGKKNLYRLGVFPTEIEAANEYNRAARFIEENGTIIGFDFRFAPKGKHRKDYLKNRVKIFDGSTPYDYKYTLSINKIV